MRIAPSSRPVSVYGAGGHTGRFVVSELERRGQPAILVGRNSPGLRAFAGEKPGRDLRIASLDDPRALDRAFEGASAVINCAGSFLDTAAPVVEAALRANIHYVDVAPEQAAAQAVFDEYDEAAKAAGIVIVPAFGFYGGLADLLATAAMGDWERADEIRIGIVLDSWKPTLGTRLTGERNNGPRYVISNGKLAPLSEPRARLNWNFPEPFGNLEMTELALSEIITISRHLQASEIHPFMNDTPLADLHDPDTPPPIATDESGRSDQLFIMEVLVRKESDERRATAKGRDIYATSAPMVVEAVERMLAPGFDAVGAKAAGEIFDAGDFLNSLCDEYFSVEYAAAPADLAL
ncbi:MAG: saccharopine dehydrogenase NADP-binding domain-containing protein [Sphingosinicella sp.]|nr:saccharopine dehydrogenase NADP-binding domain-containing protein [Sphingosinicella sp.]